MKFYRFLILNEETKKVQGGTFTELIPVIWFNYNINPNLKMENELYNDILETGLKNFNKAFETSSDIEMAENHLLSFKDDFKMIRQHINSCIGTYNFLTDLHSTRGIKKTVWSGNVKSKGGKRETADIKIIYKNNEIEGISLKSGLKLETKEYEKTTSMKAAMESILGNELKNEVEKISNDLYECVYKNLGFNKDYYLKKSLSETRKKLMDIEKNDKKLFNDYYNIQLKMVQDWFMSKLNDRKYKKGFQDFILKTLLSKKATELKIIQLKVANKSYKIMNDRITLYDSVNKIDIIRTERGKGKQDIYVKLSLIDNPKILKMWFEIRGDGSAQDGKHKLGNFWNVGVKYRGLI